MVQMAELICVVFEHLDGADKALSELQRLQADGLAELADACVARRSPAGDVHVNQSVDLVVGGAVGGGVLGTACGSLVGLWVIDPSIGMLIGAALGAATGAICGALSDYGIDDEFVARTADAIEPSSSVLFLLLRRANMQKLLARLEVYRPAVLHTSMKLNVDGRQDADLSTAARFGDAARLGGVRRHDNRPGT